MSSHHDTHDHNQQESGSFSKLIFFIIGAAFGLFSLVAGISFIYGAYVIRSGGEFTAPEKAKPSATQLATAESKPAAAAAPAASAAEILIKPDTVNPLAFDLKSFNVKAGQSVKITFENKSPVPQPHNWILGKKGTKDALIAAANAMATDPQGMTKGYVIESPDVITHIKLLNPGETGSVEFTAPAEPGEYPYICSFPGHALIMNGVMVVE